MAELPIKRMHSGFQCHQPENGPLQYDAGFSGGGSIDSNHYEEPGEVARQGMSMGMPDHIEAEPAGRLGCGCQEAWLHAIGEIQNGMIEADYMCDSGWHNFVIFELEQMGNRTGLVIDANGNLVEVEEVGHADHDFGSV